MPLLSSTKKAEQFAKLLDGSSSSGSGDLATLQGLAARLSSVPQPRAEFASALRDRLMSEATTTLPAGAGAGAATGAGGVAGPGTGAPGSGGIGSGGIGSGGVGSGAGSAATSTAAGGAGGAATGGSAFSSILSTAAPLWSQLAAGAAATAIAVTGVGVGASRSLPGDPLYGLKRQVETVQLDLAGGSTDKALAQLGFAHTRTAELTDLLSGRRAGAPLSADLQRQASTLLGDWANETSRGTTVLLDQLSAGQGDTAAIRAQLISFTDSQARSLAIAVQGLPDATLESLTGSAFAYLQRVDTALGNPVNLATVLDNLGLPLPTTATAPTTPTTPTSKPPTAGPTGTGKAGNTPSAVPTLPIPTAGRPVRSNTPSTPSIPSSPSTGGSGQLPGNLGGALPGAGNAVNGATNGATRTVDGVLNGVTGNGPGLPLPTAVPTIPAPVK